MNPYGRAKGSVTPKTRQWAVIIRRMRREKKTLQEIGDHLGTSKINVWRICRLFGITSPRDYGRKQYTKYKLTPPPIDPEKARQITESKRRWWLQQDRRTA